MQHKNLRQTEARKQYDNLSYAIRGLSETVFQMQNSKGYVGSGPFLEQETLHKELQNSAQRPEVRNITKL